MSTSHAPTGLEPGSFRDPESRVFYAGDDVYRALSPDGLSDFEELEASGLLDGERVVRTERADGAVAAEGLLVHEPAAVLRHERIPFVSYPYEWTFSMLKDAALLQLDLLLAALDHDMVLKDSTPYNVQWKGARPVFVDVGSFERLREGEPWVGYRQFCMLYLYPLLLQSAKGVPFQPWLRGAIDGITPPQMRGLMSFRDRFRKGVFTNVFLHARLEERYADRPAQVKQEVESEYSRRSCSSRTCARCASSCSGSSGARPRASGPPTGSATATPTTTLAARTSSSARSRRAATGSSSGTSAATTAATPGSPPRTREDGDCRRRGSGPVELLYRDLREEGSEQILPLTMNLADPSPARLARARARGRCRSAASRTSCSRWRSCTTWPSAQTCR